jgi:hypothetical protein
MISFAASLRQKQETSMNRHYFVPTIMRVLLIFSLLVAFVSIEHSAQPPVAQAATPVSISAGYDHTCGVKSDGTVACWGRNTFGQATPPIGSFTQVGAGDGYTCGLKSDATLACWGDNASGQATPPIGSFSQVSAGFPHTCGMRSDGTGVCWGLNIYGQAPSQVSISPADLPAVGVGSMPPALSGAGGLGGPYTFTVVSGTLPPGLTLHSDGTWTGNNPSDLGDYSFSVKVVDKGGILGVVQRFTLRVGNTIFLPLIRR